MWTAGWLTVKHMGGGGVGLLLGVELKNNVFNIYSRPYDKLICLTENLCKSTCPPYQSAPLNSNVIIRNVLNET